MNENLGEIMPQEFNSSLVEFAPLSHRLQPLPRHQRQQFQRSPARLFFAAFPLAHQPGRHIQMQREFRGGSVCLNSSVAFPKWLPALVRPPSALMAAR
jgi:hypothetical protein